LPDKDGKLDTKVELMLGGDITIGGTEYMNKKIKDSSLPLKFEIPGVHFCGMRLANCASTWTSKYEKDLQKGAKNATLKGLTIYSGKEFDLASGKVYFATGKWSVASMEKTLGPFKFSLDKYDFAYKKDTLSATLNGSITFIAGLDLSASAGIKINAELKLPSDLTKLNDISLKYANTEFLECGIGAKFAGMELSGKLLVRRETSPRKATPAISSSRCLATCSRSKPTAATTRTRVEARPIPMDSSMPRWPAT
jgi:hypothetical protein